MSQHLTLPTAGRAARSGTRWRPPFTRRLPVLGALPLFLCDPLAYLLQAQADYGDVYTLDLGVARWVILNHPRDIDYVTGTNAPNYRRAGLALPGGFAADVSDVQEDFCWRYPQHSLQAHLQRLGLGETLIAIIDADLARWADAANATRPCNLAPACTTLVARLMTGALFGLSITEAELSQLSHTVGMALAAPPWGALSAKYFPLSGACRYRRQLGALLDTLVARLSNTLMHPNTLLAVLLQRSHEERPARGATQQRKADLLRLILTGVATTSRLLLRAIHLLTQHPAALTTAQAEIDTALQGRTPSLVDLGGLHYTRMVLQETLRLHPRTWWSAERAVADDEIDGYTIPAGTTVVNFIYGAYRHPQLWAAPEHFYPEHFTTTVAKPSVRQRRVDFGGGSLVSPGWEFVLVNAQLALTMLLQRYNCAAIRRPTNDPQLSAAPSPQTSLLVKLEPRAK